MPAKVRDVRRRREAKPQARRCGFVAVSPGDRAFCPVHPPEEPGPGPAAASGALWGSWARLASSF